MVSNISPQQPKFGDLSYITGKNKYPVKYNKVGLPEKSNKLQVNVFATGRDVDKYASLLNVQDAKRGFEGEKIKIGTATLIFDLANKMVELYKGSPSKKTIIDNGITQEDSALYQDMLKALGTSHIGIPDENSMEESLQALKEMKSKEETEAKIQRPLKISA